jgi:hypothetical protein
MEQEPEASTTVDTLVVQRKLVLSLEKVLRSYRLYEARGRQYDAHVNELAGLAALATESESVAVNLSPYGPYLEDEEPPTDGEFARQWFTLFEEGARQIMFLPGIDGSELRDLLHILCAESEDNEDIVTALWRKELKHVQVFVARILIRSMEASGERSTSVRDELGRWKALLQPELASSGDPSVDEATVRLSPDDFRILALEEEGFNWCSLSNEWGPEERAEREKPRVVAAAEKEISNLGRFLDLAVDLGESADDIILNVIAGMTRMGSAEELDKMLSTVARHKAGGGRVVRRLLDSEDGLDSLIPMLEANPSSFKDSLSALADINATAVANALDKVEQPEVRDELSGFVPTAESTPLQYYSAMLLSQNSEEATLGIEELVKLGTDEAFYVALEAIKSGSPAIRRLVMRKVFERYDPALSYMVQKALSDPDKGIRILTLRFIGEDGSSNLLREALNQMKQKDFVRRDYNERIAFVRAVGLHTRLPVITKHLCGLLLERRLINSREQTDFLTEVAMHLVRSDSPEAKAALQTVLSRWSVSSDMKQAILAEQVRVGEDGGFDLPDSPVVISQTASDAKAATTTFSRLPTVKEPGQGGTDSAMDALGEDDFEPPAQRGRRRPTALDGDEGR